MNHRSFFRSLQGQFTLRMLVIGVLPLVVVGLVVYVALSNSLGDFSRSLSDSEKAMEVDVVGANLTNTATEVMREIDTYLHERMKDVLLWVADPTVVETARAGARKAEAHGLVGLPIDQIEAQMAETRSLQVDPRADDYLKQLRTRSGHFKEIFFTEAHGFNVALTNLTSDFVQSDEKWWQVAWEKGIQVGKVNYDESAGVFSIDISARIDDPATGERLGVMKAVLDITAVQAIASTAATRIKDAEVLVVNGDGLLLADTHSNHDSKFIMNKDFNLLTLGYLPAEYGLRGSRGLQGYVLYPRPIRQVATEGGAVAGYSGSAGRAFYVDVAGFEGFGWAVIVEQPRATAFAPLDRLTALEQRMAGLRNSISLMVTLVAVLAAAMSAGVAVVFARTIVSPVTRLTELAEKVSLGEVDVIVEKETDDEIGDLTDSFNRMVAAVKFFRLESQT